MSGITEQAPLVSEPERMFVQAERIPVAVELNEHWVCCVEFVHLGGVTTKGFRHIKKADELSTNLLTFRFQDMPEGLRANLVPGLRFAWHKALITYSDGTTELAESFRGIS